MPLVKLNARQRAEALRRVRAGEGVGAVAAAFGVHHGTLSYHLLGGKSRRYLGRPWLRPLRDARRELALGHNTQAAALLRIAADLLLESNP